MHQNRPLAIQYVCNTTMFAKYADLVSKEGVAEVLNNNGHGPYTHYMLLKTGRLTFTSMLQQDGRNIVKFIRHLPDGENEECELSIPCAIDARTFFLPNDTTTNELAEIINIQREKNEILVTLKGAKKDIVVKFSSLAEFFFNVFSISDCSDPKMEDILKCEVLYIGQTQIKDKYFRLTKHETYQEAIDEMIEKEPNMVPFVKLLKFEHPTFCTIEKDGSENDEKHGDGEWLKGCTVEEWITLVEGMLIRAIQPKLNVHYKDSFPLHTHTKYTFFLKSPFIDQWRVQIDESFRLYLSVSKKLREPFRFIFAAYDKEKRICVLSEKSSNDIVE